MPATPDPFRDIGILSQGIQPSAASVRCFLSTGRIVGQVVPTGGVLAVALALAISLLLLLPMPHNVIAGVGTLLGVGGFLLMLTRHDYRWVELTGTTLRAKHLYTGRICLCRERKCARLSRERSEARTWVAAERSDSTP